MLPLIELKDRVLTSLERVKFSQLDPYGHLNSCRYLEFMTNHRIEAAEDQLGCLTLDILKETGVGFVVIESSVKFIESSYCNDSLEVASWLTELTQKGFELKLTVINTKNRRLKASGKLVFCSVSAKDGKPCTMPEALPTRLENNPLLSRPLASDYLATIKMQSGVVL